MLVSPTTELDYFKLSSIHIELFNPKTASEGVWERFFEFDQTIEKELFPYDPYPKKKFIKKIMQVSSPFSKTYRWIAVDTDNNRIAGIASLFLTTKQNPNYESTFNIAEGEIKVLHNYQRNGIGQDLFLTIITKARDEGRIIFQGFTGTDSGKLFSKKLGGIEVLKSLENRCNIRDIDWILLNHWRTDCRRKAPNTSIETFTEVPEKDIEAFTKLYTEISNQQPLGDLEGETIITPELRRKTEQKMKELGVNWITKITREDNGEISGFTDIQYSFEDPKRIRQIFTGVNRKYRGKSLGKMLKTEMTFFIKDKFPHAKFITTENANSNGPMLSINNRMGFKKHIQEIGYKWNIEELMDILKE